MRRTRRLFLAIVLIVLALVVLSAGGIAGVIWYALPRGDLTAAIPSLSATVNITIDPDGIPRVRAANALDAAAALGFLHARERLFQMDMTRRAASGEVSEIAGPVTLPLDRMMRTLRVRVRATDDLEKLPPETRALLDSYARGVNAWIARRGRFSADEFVVLGPPKPWSAVDSLLWGKTMGLYLSSNWRVEMARQGLLGRLSPAAIASLWPSEQTGTGHPEARAVPSPAEPEPVRKLAALLPGFPDPFTLPNEASNEWAVDATHSATGAPLLAGDPHLAYGLPGIWYLARIETPTGVLAGATAPGVPFLVLGHNGHIAWTFTTTGSDVQDLFIETPAGPDQYMTPDGPAAFVTRTETIHVRGQPDELWTVRETRHGPVISDLIGRPAEDAGPILALSMANLMPGDMAAAGLEELNNATDVAAAGRAAAEITSPNQNLLVADRDTIGLFVTGRVPIRRAGDGAFAQPGADGAHDWIGWASGPRLPHVVAPASGRLVNANERVAPPDFPVFMGKDWFSDERARRIREMLAVLPKAGVADFERMQLDTLSVTARDLLPRLLRAKPTDPLDKAALGLLSGWDARMTIDRPQPLIFNAWMRELDAAMLRSTDASARDARAAAAPWPQLVPAILSGPNDAMLCGGDCEKMLAETLHAALGPLASAYGPDPAAWRWGTAHEAVFANPVLRMLPLLGPLIEARIAAPGDDTTVDRGGMALQNFDSVHGASFRGVYDLADLDRSRFVVAPGQSGHAASFLARNFVRRWRDGDTVALGPEPARVDVTLRLVPGDGSQ